MQPAHRRRPGALVNAGELAERQQVDAGLVDRNHLAEQGLRRTPLDAGTLAQVVSLTLDQAGVAKPDHA